MKEYTILDWDSGFFGFTVARVIPARLHRDRLAAIIGQMKGEGVRLAYWASDPADELSQQGGRSLGGFLADRKVTYAAQAELLLPGMSLAPEAAVDEYRTSEVTPQLERLALQAGEFSRFKVDPAMPAGSFEALYRLWIGASVAREIADTIYVIRHEEVAGMVTLGVKNGRADIGLIAVDDTLRGRGAGTALVAAARDWGIGRGLPEAQVVTQGDNEPACRFYEKCGYRVDKVENIYHFWM